MPPAAELPSFPSFPLHPAHWCSRRSSTLAPFRREERRGDRLFLYSSYPAHDSRLTTHDFLRLASSPKPQASSLKPQASPLTTQDSKLTTSSARSVLESTLAALRRNDSPTPNAGILALRRAEGGNAASCPDELYISNTRIGFLAPLIGHTSARIGEPKRDYTGTVIFPVDITAPDGARLRYEFWLGITPALSGAPPPEPGSPDALPCYITGISGGPLPPAFRALAERDTT